MFILGAAKQSVLEAIFILAIPISYLILIAHKAVATFDVAGNPLLNKTLLLDNE